MKSTVTDLGDNKKKVLVELSEEDFSKEIQAVLKDIAKTAEFPGFRKGKVPINYLKSQTDEQKVRSDALSNSLPKYLREAITSSSLDAIAVSDVQVIKGIDEGPITFEANVEIRSELDLKGYENLKVTISSVDPTEKEIEEVQNHYLKSFGELIDVDRNAIKGDHLTIDLRSTFNGEDVEGMNVSDYVYELGAQSVIQDLEKELTGSRVGDILEFNSPHPSGDGNMKVNVLLKKIQENKLPELNDKVASEISEFETATEFKQDMLKQIKESKRQSILRLAQDKILEELVKLVTIPISETLIQNEAEVIKSRLSEEQASQLEKEIQEQAVNSVKIDLCIRAIIKKEKLSVEEEEVNKTVELVQQQIDELPKQAAKK